MGSVIIQVVDWLLWIVMAVSVAYALLFSLASLLPRRRREQKHLDAARRRFLVLFPAYKEDKVIVQSVEAFLLQDYPKDDYQVAVISDHMQPATNERLSALPVELLTPSFEKSSKAKAMQHAIAQLGATFDHVVILDADNVVRPDFLSRLNELCLSGYHAIQCHRTAKNSDNDIAVLDGVSEEINNSIFRKGHNRLGLSAALIGSGMCFDYEWFSQNVAKLDSAVEDRELEALLMKQGIYIYYADHIYVMDEKVSNRDNFQRQRLRWMTGQVQTLLMMVPYLPKAIARGNLNYIDKTFQQALIPRSLLLVFTLAFTLLAMLAAWLSPLYSWSMALRWFVLLAVLCLSLLLAMPPRLRTGAVLGKVLLLPQLAWRMVKNLMHIDTHNKDFLHTTHG